MTRHRIPSQTAKPPLVKPKKKKSDWEQVYEGILKGWLADEEPSLGDYVAKMKRRTALLGSPIKTVSFNNFIMRKFKSMRLDLLKKLSQLDSKVSLGAGLTFLDREDCWNGYGEEEDNTQEFVVVEAQYIDENWTKHRILLDVAYLGEHYVSTSKIAEYPGYEKHAADKAKMKELLAKTGLEEKFKRMKIESAKKEYYDMYGSDLESEYAGSEFDDDIEDVAFVMDRVLGKALNRSLNVDSSAGKSIGFITSCDSITSSQLNKWNPVPSVKVLPAIQEHFDTIIEKSWQSSQYIGAFCDLADAIMAIPATTNISDSLDKKILNEAKNFAEIALTDEPVFYWRPFAKVATLVMLKRQMFEKLITAEIDWEQIEKGSAYLEAGAKFSSLKNEIDSNIYCSLILSKLVEFKASEFVVDESWIISTVLDPRYSLDFFKNNAITEWPAEKVKESIMTRWRTAGGKDNDEIEGYLNLKPLDMASDPLAWWKSNQSKYPILSKMARDYLAIIAVPMPEKQREHIDIFWYDATVSYYDQDEDWSYGLGGYGEEPEEEEPDLGDFSSHIETIRAGVCVRNWLQTQ